VNDEKRRFSRISFDADVLISKDGQEWRTALLDISLNGLLVNSPADWRGLQGEQFHAEVIFPDSGSLIHVEVSVAHNNDGRSGLQVNNIDVESVAHLRRLIELNLGDEELLNRELTSLHWR